MYRHTAQVSMAKGSLPSPAPEELDPSESESDTSGELDRKRRQLDEEVATFRAQKEKEFHEFEEGLRRKRKRKRSSLTKDTAVARTPPTDPSVLSLLAGGKPQANGHACKEKNPSSSKSNTTPPPSKPTISVDRLTIVGTTTTPAITGRPPNVLKSLSLSPSKTQAALTQPEFRQPQSPPTPAARDHNDSFAGLFTPSYLPLLDSRSSSNLQPVQSTQPEEHPNSAPPPPAQLLNSSSSSLPSSPVSPKFTVKRALTAPILANTSTSLPSALRNASGESRNARKRKHVTFRLADSSVVEPSSSYEEMSSPDLPSGSSGGDEAQMAEVNKIDEMMGAAAPLPPWIWERDERSVRRNGAGNGRTLGTDVGIQEDRDEDGSSRHLNGVPAENLNGQISPDGLQFEAAEDGGSGVGFFELDEELNSPSPKVRSPQRDRRFFDEYGEENEPDVEPGGGGGGGSDSEEGGNEAGARDAGGRPIKEGERPGASASFSGAGSVPIDIVMRPSSSWVGSFGTQRKER